MMNVFIWKKTYLNNEQDQYQTELGEVVNWVKEDNYLFNFTDEVKDYIKMWISQDPSPIEPEYIK